MNGYRSSETEIGVLASKRFWKSSRSSSRATVIVRVRRTTSAKSSVESHSPFIRTSSFSGLVSTICAACAR